MVFNDVEAARYLGVATQTLRNWRHMGRGPAYCRVGWRVVYRQEDLDQYLITNRVCPEEKCVHHPNRSCHKREGGRHGDR